LLVNLATWPQQKTVSCPRLALKLLVVVITCVIGPWTKHLADPVVSMMAVRAFTVTEDMEKVNTKLIAVLERVNNELSNLVHQIFVIRLLDHTLTKSIKMRL